VIDPLTAGPPDRDHWLVHQARAEIDLLRGHIEAAAGRRQQIKVCVGHIGSIEHARESAQRAAELALWAGRPGDALAEARRVLPLFEATDLTIFCGRLLTAGLRACGDLAEQARARRDEPAADAAAADADALTSWVDQMAGVPFTDHPFVATIPAERETWDAERTRLAGASDPEAWRGTAKTWEGLGCPHRAGYAWWRQAQAQLDAGQPAAAAATALRAVVAAADGHTPLLAQVRALAERVRIPLQPPAATPRAPLAATPPPYGLTGRELAVLRLLARAHQCADRCRAVHQPENRRCARQQYPAQAESLRPGASRRGGRTGRPARSRLPLSTPRGNLNTRGPRSWVITRSAPPGLSSILGTRLSYAAEEAAMYPAPIQYLAQARLAAGQTNVPRALLSVDPMGTCPAALAGLVIAAGRALGPAAWVARTRTATALRPE